jgi:hypothetical protein
MREKSSAAKKTHPSTPYPLCRLCSRPLPVSVCPRLPLLSRWLLSLARRRPPSPAVIVAPALVPGPSTSALACRQRPLVVVALDLVPCPSASALACRRRHTGSRPLPVDVCPRLPSSSRRLSSLARRRPPSPAFSAPSSSLRWLSSLARHRPPSPAVVIAVATTDGGAWIFFCDVFILPRAHNRLVVAVLQYLPVQKRRYVEFWRGRVSHEHQPKFTLSVFSSNQKQ